MRNKQRQSRGYINFCCEKPCRALRGLLQQKLLRLAGALAIATGVVGLDARPARAADAAPQNLVLNPGFESSAGDGQPDHWSIAGGASPARGKASLSSDAHSGRFSLLYVSPKPYDWRTRGAGDPWDLTSWRESRKIAGAMPYYSTPVVAEEFRIEYPKVYRVSAWVKAQNIAGLHIKFMGIEPKGAPTWFAPALRTPEGYYGKSGSWNWEKWETIILANRGNGWKGRIEVWMRENLTDGRFWVDDVMVEEVDHAGRGVEPMPSGAAALPVGEPTAGKTPPPSEQKVQDGSNSVTICLRNGCDIVFAKDAAGQTLGIRDVSVRGKRLRQPAQLIQPLVETESGRRYAACRFVGCEQQGEKVIVKTALAGKDARGADRLDWIIAPVELDVYEKRFAGFSYCYRFQSAAERAVGVWDRATWELGGHAEGLSLRESGGGRMLAVTAAMAFESPPVIPFLSAPCFDFQVRSGEGLLLGFFGELGHVETWTEKRSGQDCVQCFAHHAFASSTQVQTSPRCIVFVACGPLAPLQLEDVSTWALDAIKRKYRRQAGLTESPFRPTVRLHPHGADGGRFEEYLPELPEVKRLGFEVVMLDPIWESLDRKGNPSPGQCSITGLDVAQAFGGEAGLKRLADAVHGHGMKLITWAPTGLNRHDSQLLGDHPDWICRLPNGMPSAYGGPNASPPGRELAFVSFNSPYLDYSLTRYRRLRREIGLDGYWQDSFQALGQLHFANATSAVSNLLPGVRRQGQLQEMGYKILDIEGYGPFGNESYSAPGGILVYAGHHLYKTSPYYYGALGPHAYYRAIANKCMPIAPYLRSQHPYWRNRNTATNPYIEPEVLKANRDYALVRNKMARRFLIPSESNPAQEIGVLWGSQQGNEAVLFAYADFSWCVGRFRAVKDVTAGQPVVIAAGRCNVVAEHTYLASE